MGKLFSAPKAPSLPVFQPTPVVPVDTGPDPEVVAAQQREDDVLRRHRGELGTIATSFRGVTAAVDQGAISLDDIKERKQPPH